MKLGLIILLIFGSISYVQLSSAASFNCQRAVSKTEHAICEHRVLNDADVQMATTYNIVRRLVHMCNRSMIQTEQVKWLNLRDQCQDSLDCLKKLYQVRQQRLDLHLERIYQQGPF